jgi:hypothetical protein
MAAFPKLRWVQFENDVRSCHSSGSGVRFMLPRCFVWQPLDRDPPNGFSKWQVLIAANDEDGGPTSLRNNTEVIITLTDINDNAPFLDMVQPVKWDENQQPGIIVQLNARDYDSEQNGPPFIFRIADTAPEDILKKFSITGKVYFKFCV